jgi:serine/threonine-protein kinase ATR
VRQSLYSDAMASFSDERLQHESISFLQIFRDLNMADSPRPTKRRRTLQNSDEDEQQAIYQKLVMTVNGSSQDSPVVDLSGIHATIV